MMASLWATIKRAIFVGRNVSLGRRFHIGLLSFVTSHGKLTIGDDVYVGKFCTIQCNGKIGRGVLIANNVGIIGRRDHDYKQVGMFIRHARWIGNTPDIVKDPKSDISIGDDVWIGFGSVILSGITIGRGAVVGAGSVVITSVNPYEIVSGNPACVVGHRFKTPAEIDEHERILELER